MRRSGPPDPRARPPHRVIQDGTRGPQPHTLGCSLEALLQGLHRVASGLLDQSTERLRDREPEIRDLIKRLQAGHQWLLEQHRLWQTDDSTAASDSEFSRVWNGWWEFDDQLRDEHGFQGCVYGPAKKCPDGFPCRGCSDLPAPEVVAQLELT